MDLSKETVQSAVARTAEALSRLAEDEKLAQAKKQQRAQDEHVINETRKRIAILSRQFGTLNDLIHQGKHDSALARRQAAELLAGADSNDIAVEEYEREAAPLAEELAQLRRLLAPVPVEAV